MLEPEECLDILSIVRYKTQLLDIIDEAARLSESEKRRKAECIELRLEISSLKADLSAKELELATVDRTIEDGITSENARILSKENEELKVLRDNLKNLLESTQNKLKQCELEKYNAKQELEACKSLAPTRDRGLDSSAQLFDQFISMQGHAAKKFEDLQLALNDVRKERSEVLKRQLEMQTELDELKAAMDDYQADEQKYRQHTAQLKEQLIAESREQLAEALRAAYLGR
ncbi:hypothetical protein NCLIV_039810 [Neospora caninum Liverpool]|uniref:Uncharacterized protein n=1 Tax=Neospora caninum (strain Liverpool) TaxID=572307 RepID=F0VBC2_NEOCL|nr:hypothetical protein NCLIV_039810 [Neospora caninum Liverpool]CBZ50906.1 hypothetical protein NCLIV_039810 [Neospora caninum Liverpool]CEL68208.1 TPA: hypothetical protein BN1204_039810 [Neospora caninum Liverpool]|eukprot:XP_003880939.1 hypothetical protein NCLIV_039810 [Neospora caninum Liverpool]